MPPSRPSEGTKPADTLILDFQPPEPGDNTFLLCKPPACGTLLLQPWEVNTRDQPLGVLGWVPPFLWVTRRWPDTVQNPLTGPSL